MSLTHTAPPAVLGDEDGGRYRKTAKLGEGTYGVVYRAFDNKRGEVVALKKVGAAREVSGAGVVVW